MNSGKFNDGLYQKISGIITTFTLRNWNLEQSNMDLVINHIKQTKSIDIDVQSLQQYIIKFKSQIKTPLEITTSKAVLLTKENRVEIYKFGSETCPRCDMYKNYEKICPHCNHVEYYHN